MDWVDVLKLALFGVALVLIGEYALVTLQMAVAGWANRTEVIAAFALLIVSALAFVMVLAVALKGWR